uniref:Uncharacterized protein n=1 Tax=Solanum lycopersicum TaxID=4081 RepID=A0A3Q7FZK7_SOLLC
MNYVFVLQDSSKTLQVETYVWFNKRDPNLHGEWDFEPLFPGENTVDQLVEITKVLCDKFLFTDANIVAGTWNTDKGGNSLYESKLY